MKITLDEHGLALPDCEVVGWINTQMTMNQDIHISNDLVLTGIRAWLVKRPVSQRPQIEWFIYGKQVYFDDDLRGGINGTNMWEHPLMNLLDNFLIDILTPWAKL